MGSKRTIYYSVYFNHELLAMKNTKVAALRLARQIIAFGDIPSIRRTINERSQYHNKTILEGIRAFPNADS